MQKSKKPATLEPVDHRTRTGELRREKTRARLLKGALRVFAEYGMEATVVDLIIRESGVARGTFYNYFQSYEELFLEVATEVSNEIIRIVDPLVLQQSDPAARVACGVTTVIRLAIDYPVFAQFIVRGGPLAVCSGSLATEVVPRDIAAGMASGRFEIADQALAFDMILGPVLMAFHRVLSSPTATDYPQCLAQAVLLSLGVTRKLAKRFATQTFGTITLPEDSIFKLPDNPSV